MQGDFFLIRSITTVDLSGFYFITDSGLTKQGILKDVEDALRGGAKIVQYREKCKDTGAMVEEAKGLKALCRGKALFLINDRVDVCLAVDADGVHLGQTDMQYKAARKILGKGKIIGLTVHDAEEAKEAEAAGADYLGFSPVFGTKTKGDAGPAAGLKGLKEVCNAVSIPVVAIGGINLDNAGEVMKTGATTFCAISATVGGDVKGAVAGFNSIIKPNR